jgi:hypothetical protein
MEVTFLGTGAPMAPERCATGLLVRAPGCDPLLIDTCGGFELVRQLARIGQPIGGLHLAPYAAAFLRLLPGRQGHGFANDAGLPGPPRSQAYGTLHTRCWAPF